MNITIEVRDGIEVINRGKNVLVGDIRSKVFLILGFGLGDNVVDVEAGEIRLS